MPGTTMQEVVFVTRVLAHYRLPFHTQLRARLSETGIRYRLLYSAAPHDDQEMVGPVSLDWAEPVAATYWGKGCFQHVLRQVYGADLVIIGQENRLLVNYLLHVWRCFGGPPLAFFGHGRNMQSRKPNALPERFKRLWINQVDWWFAYTERCAKVVASVGFPPERISGFNNAVDTRNLALEALAALPSLAAMRQSRFENSSAIGVFTGTLHQFKRLPFLIESADLIRQKIPQFQLVVIGGGIESERLRAAARKRPWLHLTGPLHGREKAALMALGSVYMMPGLVGLGILDAFALGLPVITTRLPYHSPEVDYLEDGVNGRMVDDSESVSAYAEAVVSVLEDQALASRLRAGALASARDFTVEAMVDRFAAGVVSALAENQTSRSAANG
jgi:glycosyltransferase involved in cell wall biosynthesis